MANRDFQAELQAARDAGDWVAHSNIWEARRVADVEADEASIVDLCENECGEPAYRYGVCKNCEHPDDTEFYDFDPGAEF